MRRVDIQALVEREHCGVVVERRVRARVVRGERRVREPRDELAHPPGPLHARDRRAERGDVPEVEIDANRVDVDIIGCGVTWSG